MMFKSNEEKLKHIGLACCANLHDAFANMSRIKILCNSDKNNETLIAIKEYADQTYEIFRQIEKYRHQSEKAKSKTFMASELATVTQRFWRNEKLEVNILKDFEITCQQLLLIQALINLIDNGYAHNSNDWNKKKVLLTINGTEITVSDNGDGIPEENMDKIFDLFFTTKDLDKLYGNNKGIGLYGVKQHLDVLGYSICVLNGSILKGANFTIYNIG